MAYARANLFDEREQWRGPLLLSAGFHALLVCAMFVLGYVMHPRSNANDWGLHEGDAVTAQLDRGRNLHPGKSYAAKKN